MKTHLILMSLMLAGSIHADAPSQVDQLKQDLDKAIDASDLKRVNEILALKQVPLNEPIFREAPLTFLISAVINDNKPIVEALLNAGVDPNFHLGLTSALSMAKSKDVVQLLLKSGARMDGEDMPLIQALMEGGKRDIGALEVLIDAAAQAGVINTRDKYGYTALNSAVRSLSSAERDPSHPDRIVRIVKLLLANKADPNLTTTDKDTPLMGAAVFGNTAVAKLLLDAGANINAKDTAHGMTALMYAAQYERLDVAKLLIANGADVTLQDNRGWTASDFTFDNEIKDALKKAVATQPTSSLSK